MATVALDPRPQGTGRLTSWIADPKAVSTLAAIAWAFIAYAGFRAFGSPPTSIANELGGIITTGWAALFIIGGLCGVIGALPGWWYLERAGIVILTTGLLVYDAVVWYLHITTPGNRAVQGSIVLGMVALSLARFARISGATLDPTRGPHAKATPTLTVDE